MTAVRVVQMQRYVRVSFPRIGVALGDGTASITVDFHAMAYTNRGVIVSTIDQVAFALRPPCAGESMHLFRSQKIGQPIADAFVRIMTHLYFAASFLNVLVEQIAASYIAYQATAWTRIKATVALLTGCNLNYRIVANILLDVCLTIGIQCERPQFTHPLIASDAKGELAFAFSLGTLSIV